MLRLKNMKVSLRHLRHFSIYLGFDFLNRGIAFLLLPLFAHSLMPQEYGIYALFLTVTTLLIPFMDLTLNNAIPRVYVTPTLDFSKYISTNIFFSLAMCALLSVGALFLKPLFLKEALSFLAVAPLVTLSNLWMGLLSWVLRVEERPVTFGLVNLYSVVLQCVLSIGALVWLHVGWRGLIAVQVIVAGLRGALILWVLIGNGWLIFSFDKASLKFGLRWGMGFLFTSLAYQMDGAMGRFFLADGFDMGAVGLYAMGEKIGSLVSIYLNALANVYQPWLYRGLAQKVQPWRKIFLVTVSIFASLIIFAWGGSLMVYLLREPLLGERFQGAVIYIWFCATAAAVRGMYWITALFISYTLRTWLISIVTASAAALNFLGMWVFIRTSGVLGVAYAPLFAWLLAVLCLLYIARSLWRGRI